MHTCCLGRQNDKYIDLVYERMNEQAREMMPCQIRLIDRKDALTQREREKLEEKGERSSFW